jgi:hypothetical protein
VLDIPARESVVFARLRHFGGWLRLVAHTQDGAKRRLICYLSLKG